MNKKEAKQRIHNLEEELAELKHLLDQPEGRWRAEEGEEYVFVSDDGDIVHTRQEKDEDEYDFHCFRHKVGNYFQTKEQAKASNLYKILNSEYEYYFAGVSDNWDDVPKGRNLVERWSINHHIWIYYVAHDRSFNYRWKRI